MPRKAVVLALALGLLIAGGVFQAGAATPQTNAANQALDYIRTIQNADGGFPSFGSDSSAGATLDAVFAFAAAGVDIGTVEKGGNSPIGYLEAQADAYAATPGGAAKLVLGLIAAGEDPHAFAGADYVAKMQSYFDSAAHRYGEQTIDHALYMLARKSLGLSPAYGTVSFLKSKQSADGCWEFSDGFGCDTNTTAVAIQALLAAGLPPTDGSIKNALGYLKAAQNTDGGFPYVVPSDSDANSTAYVLQALVAAGEDVDAGGSWEKPGGRTPPQALLSFRDATTGAFTYAGEDSAYATYQAVPALLLQPLLLPPVKDKATATPRPTHTSTATAVSATTPAATATTAATIATAPTATPLAQVLPVYVGPAAPLVLASAGEGPAGADAASMPGVALLLAAAGCLIGGLLARRVCGSRG
ncbi:MAG: prenyltransferase/squalene oxidase repeat-containing protein [Dehalococcoidia bacterium]|jgi:hypothetical protein